jgi:hypothetical protein
MGIVPVIQLAVCFSSIECRLFVATPDGITSSSLMSG